MKFCEFCGKQLEDNEKCNCAEAIEENKKENINISEDNEADTNTLNKHNFYAVAGIVGVIAIIILACVFSSLSKIDPFEHFNISFSGYNSLGKAEIDYSVDDIVYEIIGEEPENYNNLLKWTEKYDMYTSGINVEYSSTENLSNGDIITVTFNIIGEAKSKVKSGSKTYEVSGLSEVETVDVFKDIEVVYKGINGNAHANIKIKTDSEFLEDCVFSFSENDNLCSNDKITVTITNIDELAEYYNCIPSLASKEYTVPKLAELVKSAEQIPVDVIKNLITQFIKDEVPEDDFLFTYGEAKYYNTYFGVGKKESWIAEDNHLMIYIEYDEYLRGSFNRKIYKPLEFINILINTDGVVELNYEDGISSTFTTDINASVEDFKEDYEVAEIKVDY